MSIDRYSVAQSSSVAGTTASCAARAAASPCSVTPASARADSSRGRNGTSRWTSSVSAALQTLTRWVLALSTIASAIAGSAEASTYTWQLPTPVSITGTVDSRTTRSISEAPPRGMTTSTRPRAPSSSPTEARSAGSSSIDPAGRPAFSAVSVRTATSAALVRNAEAEPRSRAALPLLRHRPAASTVTLGRAS